MRKTILLLFVMLLNVSLLLQGCSVAGNLPGAETDGSTLLTDPVTTNSTVETLPHHSGSSENTEPSKLPPETDVQIETEPSTQTPIATEQTDPPADPGHQGLDDPMLRWKNAGARDYLLDEPVNMVSFAEMDYLRPDMDRLYSDFDALIEQAAASTDTDALLDAYYAVYDQYINYYTMDTLANIHHSLDTTNAYYNEEYDFCEAESPTVEEKLESLYKTFANGPARNSLEQSYFGEGFFDTYDDYEVYTNETYLSLAQEEENVLAEYRALIAEPTIEYEGEEQSFWELLNTENYSQYIDVLRAYYDKYNPLVGEKYLQLVRIRKQMAEALGYDSYAEFCYDYTYGRDYTPEQGRAFIDDIETYIVPVQTAADSNYSLAMLQHKNNISEDKVKSMVKNAAENIGGYVADAYHFMEAYDLFDITQADEKTDSSFMTYIYNYESPFVFVNSEGTSRDYTTFAHEFGHFTDAYYTYRAEEDLETAETFSQAMEFLALTYTDKLTNKEKQDFIRLQMVDLVQTFTSQAAFARFEDQVYELPDDELTVDRVNEIFLQCCKDYGLYSYGFDFYFSQYWIDVTHFFEVPYYVISYCVSAETALQVYQEEDETPGAGVDAFFRLLDREGGAGVQQVMKDAELNNPFRSDSLSETADFFMEKLGLN